jgi:hypothetical protein
MQVPAGLKDWRTTLPSAVSAAAGFVLFSPDMFPAWTIEVAKYIWSGGLFAFGVTAVSRSTSRHDAKRIVDKQIQVAVDPYFSEEHY